MSGFVSSARAVATPAALSVLAILLGCTAPPEGGGGGGGGDADLIWEEGSGDNEEPWDAESVDDDWEETVIIEGSMDRCDYNQSEDWEYTGDNDSFEVEVPADGYLDAKLEWDHNSDLDLYIYINGGGQSWSPDDQETRNGDVHEDWVPEQEFESGDDITFTIVCSQGPGGDYTLTVNWES